MKWFRRILFFIATLVTCAALLATYGFWKSGLRPQWYKPLSFSGEQIDNLQQQVMNELSRLETMAAKAHALESAARKGAVAPTKVAGETLKLSDQELNALFLRLVGPDRERIDKFVQDPQIRIQDGQVILAATLKGYGRVVSAHFEPYINGQGMLDVNLTSLQVGQLPIPQSLLWRLINPLEEKLDQSMSTWRQDAAIEGDTGCNMSAVDVAVGRMALNALRHKPAPAVLFPPDVDPVQLTSLKIEDGAISLHVQPMSSQASSQALDELRGLPAPK